MAKVLLVEPDVLLGQTYSAALKQADHLVTWCQTAQQAIQTIDSKSPDIVILELQLAMHNGIEFLYEFRTYNDWQQVPVIVLSHVLPTLKAMSPVLWDHLHIAAYHYKPLTKLSELTRSVDRVLSNPPYVSQLA